MFTKRKAVKKNVKKNINDLECEDRKEKLKTTGRVDSWEYLKKKGKNNSPYVQLNRHNVELIGEEKAEEEKGETKAEKHKWEKNNKNRKEKDREKEKEKEKRKMSYKERKQEDVTNKVNIGKTSFLIYSENDDEEENDNYITLKKKKRNKRFNNYMNKLAIKEMKREERNISKNEKLKNVSADEIRFYASKKKDTYLMNESHRNNELDDQYRPSYNEKYKNKLNTYMDHRENAKDENECVQKLHEHNFHLNLKDEEEEDDNNVKEDIREDVSEDKEENEHVNKNEMDHIKETGQRHVYKYEENGEYYSFLNMEQSVIEDNQQIMFSTQRSVEKKETQNEEEQRQRHQQEQQQQSYNMFMNEENYAGGSYGETVMVQFTDEKEENDEETKQLIEKIKIKKKILRKKNEMKNSFENEFREYMRENISDEDGNIYNNKKKNLYLSTVDFEKNGIDDDFEIEDIYNYETLEEIKKRLLIKKNTNEETKNIFHDFNTAEVYDTRLLSEIENENSLDKRFERDDFFEKEKIENIINKRVMANAKQELDFYESNRKNRFEETDDENENDEKKESRGISNKGVSYRTGFRYNSFSQEHTVLSKGEPLRERRKTCENEDESNGDIDRGRGREKTEKKENDKEPTLSANPPCFRKLEQDGLYWYNKSNEQLFEKIKKTFKDKNVCNLQLVKMKKYIYNLFNEYKSKQDKYNQNENTESKNKEEYRRLTYLCKRRKGDVIVCTLFLEFFHNIRNVLLEKKDLVDSALRVLQKMEKTFHLIYQELKIYLYKEFYEKYKLAFTNNYIFHLKYYRSKKERQKQKRLKKLEKKNVLIKSESLDGSASDLNEKILEQVDHVELFNNIPLLYLFDGFSSNYSSDSSNSSKTNVRSTSSFVAVSSSPTIPSTASNGVKEKKKNQEGEEKKQRIRKVKYCQTMRMEQLKKRFLTEVNNVCNDVKVYFLNFKNIIKHFYILKSYSVEMYRQWKCAVCFEEIFFFYVKWEILHWDPIFQFSVKMNRKKKRMLNYCKKNSDIKQFINNSKLGENENSQSHWESSSSNSSEKERIYWESENDSEKSDDSFFSLISSDESSGVSSGTESEEELEKGEMEKNEGNKGEGDRGKKRKGKLKRGEMRGSETKKKDIKKKDGKNGKDGKNYEKWEYKDNKDLFSLFQNTTFRNAKYRFRKRIFDNPSIKSFEWYKFIESIIIVSDVKDEKTLLRQLYRKVLNKRIFEIIEIWNPFSLKQSASMFVIIKEFLMYNNCSVFEKDVDVLNDESKVDVMGVSPNNREEKKNWKATDATGVTNVTDVTDATEGKEMDMLIQKIKDKMNECQSVILESNIHIDTLRKRNIFLMRCLKFFKCFKNILYMLKNNELSEIVKKIYCDFVLTNYVNSVKFHNFIFVSIIEILLFLDFSDEKFVKEITDQYNSIKELI